VEGEGGGGRGNGSAGRENTRDFRESRAIPASIVCAITGSRKDAESDKMAGAPPPPRLVYAQPILYYLYNVRYVGKLRCGNAKNLKSRGKAGKGMWLHMQPTHSVGGQTEGFVLCGAVGGVWLSTAAHDSNVKAAHPHVLSPDWAADAKTRLNLKPRR
jgi:hypothetical protein